MSCPELHDEHRTFRLARDPKRLQEGITVLHERPCATREAFMQKRMSAVWALISPALPILASTASAEDSTLVLACGACPKVSAQAGPNVDAVGQWLRDLTEEGVARQQDALLHDAPSAEGAYVVHSIADLDAPPIVKTHFQDEAVARYTGVMTVAMGTIPSVAALMAQTPVRVLSDQILRERLPVPPAGIAGTPLRAARLVNTDWWGTRSGINATGLSRIYLLEGTGFIEFSEDSYRLGAGKIIQFKEALNATVGDTPAMSHMERSVDGRGMAVLSWVTPEKSFQLRLVTDDGASIEKGAELLMQIAEGIDR